MTTSPPADAQVCFAAITTRSHWPGAMLTLRSVLRHMPGVSAVVLLIDAEHGAVPDADAIRVLDPQQCVARSVFEAMRRKYTAAELCFALKPFLIGALLDAGMEQVHYLDGDIGVYAGLAPLTEALHGHDILVTPHYLAAPPDDGRQPHVLSLLRAGVFNGGYIGVRKGSEGRRFVEWWGQNVARYGHNDPWAGMCGDQRWLDLLPALFPGMAVLRHPGANVAYWNLHERSLRFDGGRWMVDSAPLLFFHFSGFDPNRPGELSRFQNRVEVAADPVLGRLLQDYAENLLSAGYDEYRKLGYAYTRWWHRDTMPIRLLRYWYFRVREGIL